MSSRTAAAYMSSAPRGHASDAQAQYLSLNEHWYHAQTIDIEDDDITFDGKPLSMLFEQARGKVNDERKRSHTSHRGRKLRRE